MYSEKFMRFLMDYQKSDFEPRKEETHKEIQFNKRGGKLVRVTVEVRR